MQNSKKEPSGVGIRIGILPHEIYDPSPNLKFVVEGITLYDIPINLQYALA